MESKNKLRTWYEKCNTRIIDSTKLLLSPLHIKLDLIKQFVKALNKKKIASSTCYIW